MRRTILGGLTLSFCIALVAVICVASSHADFQKANATRPVLALVNEASSEAGLQRQRNRREKAKSTKVAKVVPELAVNPKVAKTLQTDGKFRRLVSVSGNTIKAKPGYVIARLDDGQHVLTNGHGNISSQMEVITVPVMQGGIWVYACKCEKTVDGQEDGCKFANKANPAQGCTGPTCCQFISGYITDAGTWSAQVVTR